MAFPTSDSGYFTITALSFSPSVIAVGESVSFSITIKNTSGKSVTSCYIRMAGTYPSTNASNGMGYVSSDVFLHGGPNSEMSSISWGNNVSKTFTGTFPFLPGYYAVDGSDYLFPVSAAKLYLSIVTNATFANGTNYENFGNLRGTDGEYLAILSKRDNPKLTFAVERTPNDESEKVKTSILLTSDVSSGVFTSHGYSANLYRSSDHHPATTADTVTSLDATIDQMLSGITDSTSAIATTLSNGSDWSFLLVVSNGYEAFSASTSIPRAFANMHLSGCTTGGVAFGKFSASTENDPKFECMYPVYLYGGIAQIGDGWTYLTPINGTTPAGFGGSALRCRKIENLCIVDGSINVKPGSSYVTIANLPKGYTPAYSVHAMNACSGSRIARVAVGGASEATAGQLVLHWAKNLSDGSNYTSAAIWIQCSIMYWVD